ncbi:DUF6457 domain-containing protein [Calidifontibacter terrae]
MSEPEQQWQAWVEKTCAALELDPTLVDIDDVHALSRDVAREVERPLAPVSAFILGLAIGARASAGLPVDRGVRDELISRFPLD